MPRESKYFEEAMVLCGDSDSRVAHLAESLYRRMLEENRQHARSPVGAFNILYFVQTVIRVWLSRQGDVMLTDTQFPLACKAISGINWPEPLPPENSIIRDFVNRVKEDSVPTEDEFDVTYATEIMRLTFDANDAVRPYTTTSVDEDFEQWLSGFSNDRSPEPPFDKSETGSKRVKN